MATLPLTSGSPPATIVMALTPLRASPVPTMVTRSRDRKAPSRDPELCRESAERGLQSVLAVRSGPGRQGEPQERPAGVYGRLWRR
jgi:hypothetical protein